VELSSTFRLEHRAMRRFVFPLPELDATVFLVGDAAVSLPFFRGMACLGACVHALARLHVDLCAARAEARPFDVRRYDAEAGAIAESELGVVAARALLIRVARELVRISSLVPFPIQSWFLAAPDAHRPAYRATIGFAFNLAAALSGLAACALGPLASWWWGAPWGWLWAVGLVLHALGGVAHAVTTAVEPGPHDLVRRLWQVEIALLLVAGVATTVAASWASRALALPHAALSWLLAGASFVVGLYAFERATRRTLSRADL
jgi:hypothetical protein